MILLSVDQSMASCACVVFSDEDPIFKEVIHTTGAEKGKEDKWKFYFNNPVEQMKFITDKILDICKSFKVEHIVLESLSFGSAGNATRDLAGLFFCIQLSLLKSGYTMEKIHTIAPTSVKSWARELLPKEEQNVIGKNKKLVKIKMGKDEMMRVCSSLQPGFLSGYNKSGKRGGATDLADAYLIGRCFLERNGGVLQQ